MHQLNGSDKRDGVAGEAQQIAFLSILIHEATHLRDLRTGKYAAKQDRRSCIAAESAGLLQALAFKQDVAAAVPAPVVVVRGGIITP